MVVNKGGVLAQPNLNMRRYLADRRTSNDHLDNANGNQINDTNSRFHTNTQSSSTTTRRTTASSTVRKQLTSTTTSDLKATNMKTGLVEFKNNLNDMKSIVPNFQKMRSSFENLMDGPDDEEMQSPVVTFPDDTPGHSAASSPTRIVDSLKFEQTTTNNFRKTKVVKDGFSAEKESSNTAEMKKVQAGDMSYEESHAAAASRARLENDGVSAEKNLVRSMENRLLKAGDLTQEESKNLQHTNMKVTTGQFSTETNALETQHQTQTISSGFFNQESRSTSTHTMYTNTKGISTSSTLQSSQMQISAGSEEDKIVKTPLDDLAALKSTSTTQEVDRMLDKYNDFLNQSFKYLQKDEQTSGSKNVLDKINDVIKTAWNVPTHGYRLGNSLCNTLRECRGLDLLIANCTKTDLQLKFISARLLEQCLTTENRTYVVNNGLEKVVAVARSCTSNITEDNIDYNRVGTGILEHLFKHSEETCSDVVRLGGLDSILYECRKNDVETLRRCAGALANLSLYGGKENQEVMIERNAPMWLFPLAVHSDDNIKYYACLAITVLVANAEIEADVLRSGTLDLVEPFVTSRNPSEFARSNQAHAHGQSEAWLQHLVPVLNSKREESRNLAAFHFCMEAGIKKQQGNTEIFSRIGAIESLKMVASCPNAVASKYAAQALRLIGEIVPHKLSQQVPLWSVEDVSEWVKQIGFDNEAKQFLESKVDGDLLLQLTEDNLIQDIELTNGIKRKRFTRELQKLKKLADYSSKDSTNINNFLQNLGPELSIYTYSFLNAGVEKEEVLRYLSEDQLLNECGITNSIHRFRIMEGIKQLEHRMETLSEDNQDKPLDVFISYRRSNGSQLASLLKVHLQLRGFSVFIDVERLEAGKFDNNLLQSIKKTKHFLLVLTPNALERCKQDGELKDWVHREIVAALQSQCNIIPIIDTQFNWPEAEDLPEDMRPVCHFNGVRWIHDYQDACVDKLERFMRGEFSSRADLQRVLGKAEMVSGPPSAALISRSPPVYQRTHSNESGNGKSDKDYNGNPSSPRGD